MLDMNVLVEDEEHADAYFKKMLLRSGIFFLACIVLPWGSVFGHLMFSWTFPGGMVWLLLVSGVTCLALCSLANLPVHLRAGIPALLALVMTIIGVLRSGQGAGVSLSAGSSSIQMHTLWPFAIIGLGLGCGLYAVRPGHLLARVIIAAGAAVCIIGFFWPMGYASVTPLRALLSSLGSCGGLFMLIATLLLLLLFPAAIAAAVLVLPSSDTEGRRTLAHLLCAGFTFILPAVFIVLSLGIWAHGIGLFFFFYTAIIMAIYMLFMVQGGTVLIAHLTSAGRAGGSRMVTLDSIPPPAASSPESLLQSGTPMAGGGLSPQAVRKLEVLENLYRQGQISPEQYEARKKYVLDNS